MGKNLQKRLIRVAARRPVDDPFFIRMIVVARPDMDDDDQDRWIDLAEACVLAELKATGTKRLILSAHVEEPRQVTIDAGRCRYWVEIDEQSPIPTASIARCEERGW